jgi:hypothetical protein
MAGQDGCVQLLPARLVDRLPQSWWAVGNLHFIPRTSKTWHFCVGKSNHGVSVRTIELLGRVVAHGRQPFDFEQSRLDGDALAVRQEAADERRFGPVD